MRTLYPDIEPYRSFYLEREGHQIYVEECGRPEGLPVLFLHGGPGSGCRPYHRSLFDPERCRVVLFDQRGAGRSTPYGRLELNTTDHLLSDIEDLRHTLGIDRWLLFGGSWGATLALLYAQRFPAQVAGMVLRGTFLARQSDLDWFVGEGGVRRIYPEAWQRLLNHLPAGMTGDPLSFLHQQLHTADELGQVRAARAWHDWSSQILLGADFDPAHPSDATPNTLLQQARIELHYAVHRYFIEEDQILRHCERLSGIPVCLIHGRRDLVCPPDAAFELHQRLPASSLEVLPEAGHLASGEAMIDALIRSTEFLLERMESSG